MPIRLIIVLLLVLSSCNKIDEKHILEIKKETKKQNEIFKIINKSWVFDTQPSNETAQRLVISWTEWRIFLDELSKKPKSTIGAFQQKARNLSTKALNLKENIPVRFRNSAMKSRIAVLTTKMNMLELYINLTEIPDNKIVDLIKEINIEINHLQTQMDEIDIKSKIQVEDGEEDLIRMMDTTRAIKPILDNSPSE